MSHFQLIKFTGWTFHFTKAVSLLSFFFHKTRQNIVQEGFDRCYPKNGKVRSSSLALELELVGDDWYLLLAGFVAFCGWCVFVVVVIVIKYVLITTTQSYKTYYMSTWRGSL